MVFDENRADLRNVGFWFNTDAAVRPRRYEGVSKSLRTKSITKYKPTTMNTSWEATQRVMAAELTRLTHKIAIQLHLVAESCTVCSSRARRSVRELLDTPSYEFHLFVVEASVKFIWKETRAQNERCSEIRKNRLRKILNYGMGQIGSMFLV
jgi:hypothetical protein